LRARDGNEYPYFDPADGGVDAEVLFLFEKPGPMTVEDGRGKRVGSGFISRDNDDPTAQFSGEFWRQAGFSRKSRILWNVVPGVEWHPQDVRVISGGGDRGLEEFPYPPSEFARYCAGWRQSGKHAPTQLSLGQLAMVRC